MLIHLLPQLRVNERKKPAKVGTGNHGQSRRKYDHWQILQDRISGMSWPDIADKHNIKSSGRQNKGWVARKLAMSSNAIKRLKPHEVAALNIKDQK